MESKDYTGTHCPSCGSWRIRGDAIDDSWRTFARRDCSCESCGAKWTETLEVTGFDELELSDAVKESPLVIPADIKPVIGGE